MCSEFCRKDLDFSNDDNFSYMVNLITRKKFQSNEFITFENECRKLIEKQKLIDKNEQTFKEIGAMEIFIKIFNSLKKIVNSWESDQQVKKFPFFFLNYILDKIFGQKIQATSKLLF